MNEQQRPDDHSLIEYDAYRESIEREGPDKLEGLTGLDNEVSAQLITLIENIIQDVAKNPNLKSATPELVADAIIKGLNPKFLTKANIISFFNSAKSEQS